MRGFQTKKKERKNNFLAKAVGAKTVIIHVKMEEFEI